MGQAVRQFGGLRMGQVAQDTVRQTGCLILNGGYYAGMAMAQRGGTRLVAVMMYGSDDLWDQGRALLDWGFSQSGQ